MARPKAVNGLLLIVLDVFITASQNSTMTEHSNTSIPHDIPYFIWAYCTLVGFFAQSFEVQCALVPSRCEPTYASFNEGDGSFSWPLQILFGNLRDVAVTVHYNQYPDEPESLFVSEALNDMLLEAINILEKAPKFDGFFDTSCLDEPNWSTLRIAARNVWQTLDKKLPFPFDNWRDFIG